MNAYQHCMRSGIDPLHNASYIRPRLTSTAMHIRCMNIATITTLPCWMTIVKNAYRRMSVLEDKEWLCFGLATTLPYLVTQQGQGREENAKSEVCVHSELLSSLGSATLALYTNTLINLPAAYVTCWLAPRLTLKIKFLIRSHKQNFHKLHMCIAKSKLSNEFITLSIYSKEWWKSKLSN